MIISAQYLRIAGKSTAEGEHYADNHTD